MTESAASPPTGPSSMSGVGAKPRRWHQSVAGRLLVAFLSDRCADGRRHNAFDRSIFQSQRRVAPACRRESAGGQDCARDRSQGRPGYRGRQPAAERRGQRGAIRADREDSGQIEQLWGGPDGAASDGGRCPANMRCRSRWPRSTRRSANSTALSARKIILASRASNWPRAWLRRSTACLRRSTNSSGRSRMRPLANDLIAGISKQISCSTRWRRKSRSRAKHSSWIRCGNASSMPRGV